MSLADEFEKSADEIKNKVNKTLTDDELKEIYALYKQATVGDVNIDKPGMMDLRGNAKWEAWNSKKGMSNEDAMKNYVEKAKELKEKHGLAN